MKKFRSILFSSLTTFLLTIPLVLSARSRIELGPNRSRFVLPSMIGTNNTAINTNSSTVSTNTGISVTNQPVITAIAIAPIEGGTNLVASIQMQDENQTVSEFGADFAKAFYVGEVTVRNNYSNSIIVYSSSLKVRVRYIIQPSDYKKISTNDQDLIKGWIPDVRRPATFSDILALFDYWKKANWRQQTVDYIKSAGQIAAGAGVFIGGVTYPRAVSFVTGIINPEAEKHLLWDVLLHAKNLDDRSFKEIEEIAAYKPITKLVYFPKGGIPGILPGILVYLNYFPTAQDIEMTGAQLNNQQPIQTKTLASPQ